MSQPDKQQWIDIQRIVTAAMAEHVRPFATAVSGYQSDYEGTHVGTGAYLQLNGGRFLFTNEHVARAMNTHRLAHLMGEHYVRVQEPFWALGEPVDAAIARIHDRDWSAIEHDAEALPCGRLAMTHSPHENELLFVVGFSGQRSRFSPSLGTLFTRGTPYLTQEADVPGEWKAESTFALFYNSEGATSIDASTRGLPMAQGFSGSLVWDTKAVRCWHEGRTWDPELAEVTGLVWGWPTSAACLLGTKIEHLKSFMLHALRREAAYFSWLSRGSPNGDDLTDWLIAVSEVPELC